MSTLIHRCVAQARAGENPTVIGRLPSAWVLLGNTQFLRGYCLLVADPVVGDLHELSLDGRLAFLSEMALLGEALMRVTDAARINYEILGNSAPALHAHLFPRYHHEPPEQREGPVWLYERAAREGVPFDHRRDHPLMQDIARELAALGAQITDSC
jgi:diadenosine tetraphosphate (Ap4A) HIT family hydrolase